MKPAVCFLGHYLQIAKTVVVFIAVYVVNHFVWEENPAHPCRGQYAVHTLTKNLLVNGLVAGGIALLCPAPSAPHLPARNGTRNSACQAVRVHMKLLAADNAEQNRAMFSRMRHSCTLSSGSTRNSILLSLISRLLVWRVVATSCGRLSVELVP